MGLKNQKRVGMGAVPILYGFAFALVVIGALVYWQLDEKCKQLNRDINNYTEELRIAEKNLANAETVWLSLLTPENIERLIKKHLLPMALPEHSQIVYYDANGRMIPNQPSAANFKKILVPTASRSR